MTALTRQRDALVACIAANQSAQVGKVDRIRLDAKTSEARSHLRLVRKAIDYPNGGYAELLGPNGRGPRISLLLDECAEIRGKYQGVAASPPRARPSGGAAVFAASPAKPSPANARKVA